MESTNEILKIQQNAGFRVWGRILILTAAAEIAPKNWWGEFFILILDNPAIVHYRVTDLDGRNFPEEVAVNAEYMVTELKQLVETQLSEHFYQKHAKTMEPAEPQSRELIDAEKVEFFHVLRVYACTKEVTYIAEKTRNLKIKKYLTAILQEVVRIPPLPPTISPFA